MLENKNALLTRRNELEALRQQHLANANACAGAIQECEHWLGEIAKIEAAAAETEERNGEKAELN